MKIFATYTILFLSGTLAQTSFAQGETPKPQIDIENLPLIQDTDLSIEIASKQAEFSGREPIQLDVTLKNKGASKTKLRMYPMEFFYDIQVVGPRSIPAPRLAGSFRRFAGSTEPLDLDRSRTNSGWIVVNNLFDMSEVGNYKIKVSKRFRLANNKQEPVTIESNTLSLAVTSLPPVSGWN